LGIAESFLTELWIQDWFQTGSMKDIGCMFEFGVTGWGLVLL
jgi:hypothetical protein